MGYMSELLGLPVHAPPAPLPAMPSTAGMHAKLVKADYHGSLMSGMPIHAVCFTGSPTYLLVRKAKNKVLEGLSGIVIHETANAFKVITRADQLKSHVDFLFTMTLLLSQRTVIPKQNSIFVFAVPLIAPSSSEASDTPNLNTVIDAPHIEFELYGNQFRFRAADRSGRKFKSKETIEL